MQKISRLLAKGMVSALSIFFVLTIILVSVYFYLNSLLPDVETLRNVQLQVPLRIYSSDKKLMAEYGEKRRIPVTIAQIPKPLVQALLATEDQRYYEHVGVDIFGLGRAGLQLLRTGVKSQGGSTITMQVARNFFLNRKKTFVRKINEILLAIKIDHELSKDKILELYLNKIYFGNRAYGVAAAAEVYYGKKLNELTLAQMATIAGLPKAPSTINPIANPAAALKRRNHVLSRMFEEGYIDKQTYEKTLAEPISAHYHHRPITLRAPYVAEMIRQALIEKYGKAIYTQGFQVFTTIDSTAQKHANAVIRKHIMAYDKRHGFRGPVKNLGSIEQAPSGQWINTLKTLPRIADLEPAAVIDVTPEEAHTMTQDGRIITLKWEGIKWARRALENGRVGPEPHSTADVLSTGDVIYITHDHGKPVLSQLPDVEAALVAIAPLNGAVKSLVGGFSFGKSKFNRVTQMQRQPGSSFKPFIYAAGLSKGFTLATLINDAPIVRDDPTLQNLWRPQNDNKRFYGPTRLRIGLTRSRNLVSIRLLDSIGIPYATDFLEQFGFTREELPQSLSLALGSLDITPLQLATAYAALANGGFKVRAHIIDHIRDANGKVIMRAKPALACFNCAEDAEIDNDLPPEQQAKRILTPQVAFLINAALRDVIVHGTGRRARVLKRSDLAGKTGTTNDQVDAWFAGYTPHVVTVTWMGFDNPQTLNEYAAKAVLPMWIDYMRYALKGQHERVLDEPDGMITVRIDPKTGLLATTAQKSIFEIFRKGKEPKQTAADAEKQRHNDDMDSDEEHIF